VDIYGAGAGIVVIAPYPVQEYFSGKHPASVEHQEFKQLVLLVSKVNPFSINGHLITVKINNQIVDLYNIFGIQSALTPEKLLYS
jgi:hypothetical protein